MLLGRHSRVCHVIVGPLELVESARLRHVFLTLLADTLVLVDHHHVFEVVALGGVLGSLGDAAEILLSVCGHVVRGEALSRLVVKSAGNRPLETLGSVVGVALPVEVLRVDARDESRVARHALVTDIVRWAIHPRARSLGHIAAHLLLLELLVAAIDRSGPHADDMLLAHRERTRVVHRRCPPGVAEILTGLLVAFTGGMANDVHLERDVARVAWNLLSALHFIFGLLTFN